MGREIHSQQRRAGFAASALLLLAFISAAALIAFPRFGPGSGSNDRTHDDSALETRPVETAGGSLATSDRADQAGVPSGSACHLPGSNETALGSPPAATWELVGTMAVPAAPHTSGPGVVDVAGFRTCFAQTPAGALFAAANFWATGIYGDSARAYRELTARGPGRDAALAGLSVQGPGAATGSTTKLQFVGFVLRAFEPGAAIFDLGVERDDGSLGSLPTKLVWEDGDWKVALPVSGDPGVRQLPNLREYIPWGGV